MRPSLSTNDRIHWEMKFSVAIANYQLALSVFTYICLSSNLSSTIQNIRDINLALETFHLNCILDQRWQHPFVLRMRLDIWPIIGFTTDNVLHWLSRNKIKYSRSHDDILVSINVVSQQPGSDWEEEEEEARRSICIIVTCYPDSVGH